MKKALVVLLIFIAAGLITYLVRPRADCPPRYGGLRVRYSPPADGERLRGRDFVRLGEPGKVRGVLYTERGEWFLSADGKEYELHFGDHGHRESTGIQLMEGAAAEAAGFMYGSVEAGAVDLAVCTVIIGGDEFRFREDDGTPLWRGGGSGGGPGRR